MYGYVCGKRLIRAENKSSPEGAAWAGFAVPLLLRWEGLLLCPNPYFCLLTGPRGSAQWPFHAAL